MDWKDVLTRAAWTAGEAFLAVLLPALTTDILSAEVATNVAIAAGIAALAAALTVVKEAIKNRLSPEA